MISKQLANQIVEQTMLRLHRNINVMNTNGMILASGDQLRVESIHEGAKIVAESEKPLIITEQNMHLFPKTKPGINQPIYFQNELVGVVGITGDPNEILEIASLVQLTTEMMVHQALIATQSEWKRKMREHIFEDLLNQVPLDKVMIERLSKVSFIPEPPFYLIIIKATPKQQAYQSFIEYLEDFYIHESVLVGKYQSDEHFILTSGIDGKVVRKNLTTFINQTKKYVHVKMGVGQTVNQLCKIHYAYDTAKTAMEYSKPSQVITFYEHVELYSLLKKKDSPEAQHFTNRILKNLNNKLIHTLEEYLHCNQQLLLAAEVLNIHRHTLSYRLNQIHEQTGYNPLVFQDAIVLQIALWLSNKYKKKERH
ncbi:CdaR family transcriptional regulator [Rummeliibacillus sp. NPDC094406]|uniref:CdaR family transcriptional regulator n=1 Tax=Rummeliibacillus sp. NPDC094406 TaxID=3364511 RepID=UPI00382ECEE9